MADNLLQSGLSWLQDPRRTQQLQQVGGLLSGGISNLQKSKAEYDALQAMAFADPRNPLKITDQNAFNRLAEMAQSGPLSFAPAGIFIGSGAKTFNKAMADKFLEMEKQGLPVEQMWKETGTFRSPDKKLRQEINDLPAKGRFDPNNEQIQRNKDLTAQLIHGKPYAELGRAEKNAIQKDVNDFEATLPSNLVHPELYRAYPDLKAIESTGEINPIIRGRHNVTYVNDVVKGEGIKGFAPDEEGLKSTLLHEAQHAIQLREGHAAGGSPTQFPWSEDVNDAKIIATLIQRGNQPSEAIKWMQDNLNRRPSPQAIDLGMNQSSNIYSIPNPTEQYKRLAGEAEARAVQTRKDFTPQQRLETFPLKSYDVPINELTYRDPFGNPFAETIR